MVTQTHSTGGATALPTDPARQPTYGAFLEQTDSAVREALHEFETQRIDLHRAHGELMGYERFLRVSGHHLTLLASLGHTESQAWRTLGDRLSALPIWTSDEGNWVKASELLGTAHDLVASHLGPHFRTLTPEIEDLAGEPSAGSAARHLISQLSESSRAVGPYLERVVRRHHAVSQRHTSTEQLRILGTARRTIAVHGRAAQWDLRDAAPPSVTDQLRQLTPSPTPAAVPLTRFASSVEALRLLRFLNHAQASGQVPASPISLRDLALLGASVTDPGRLDDLRDSAPALHRLEHAHLQDQLSVAHRTWADLADHLLSHTQGLTKAPRSYALAIKLLQRDESPALRTAVARALPELGRSAGETIRQLASQNALVNREKAPAEIQAHWRPMKPGDIERLADLFTDAGAASALAAEINVGEGPLPEGIEGPAELPQRSRDLGRGRETSR